MQGVNKKRIGAYDRASKHLNSGSFQFSTQTNKFVRPEIMRKEGSHNDSLDSQEQRQPKMGRRIIKVSEVLLLLANPQSGGTYKLSQKE